MYPTNKDRTTVIDPSYHWQPLSTAPLGKKVQLINKDAGVAVYGQVNATKEQFFTHWAPLPTFGKVKPEPPPTVEYVGKRSPPTPPPIRFGEYPPIPKWPPILVRVLAVIMVVCVLVDIINSIK